MEVVVFPQRSRRRIWVAAAVVLVILVAAPAASGVPWPPAPLLQTTVAVTVSGHGRVVGAGIDCAPTCTATLPFGTVTLEAVSAEGATFIGWDGACSGSATTCVVPAAFFAPVI